jgi:acyl carrier protein
MYMDALAHQRRGEGLPATAINWGAWSEIGSAADRGADMRAEAGGLGIIPPETGIALLERMLQDGSAQVGVVPVQWSRFLKRFASGRAPAFLADMEEAAGPVATTREAGPAEAAPDVRRSLDAATPEQRRELLAVFVAEAVHRVLGLEASEEVDARRPLNEQGMDSLMAVELRNRLKTALALERALPATLVFDYPTVDAITAYLLKDILFPKSEEPATPPADQNVDDALSLLDNIEQLSDEEVERLLSK